jgi:hypothetical protein
MKWIVSFLLLLAIVMSPLALRNGKVEVNSASAYEWDTEVTIQKDRLMLSRLGMHQHHQLLPIIIDNPYGAHTRIEIVTEDGKPLPEVEIDIYRVPDRWRDVSHNFSMGGGELIATVTHPGDLAFLPYGEYIFRIRGGHGVDRVYIFFGPKKRHGPLLYSSANEVERRDK